jgi:hypothetical protein
MTTEKRFYISGIGISDRERKRLYDLKTVDGFISVRDLLNELHDENTHIKNTIKEMYNNERTELGKSTLKQLLEAIQ